MLGKSIGKQHSSLGSPNVRLFGDLTQYPSDPVEAAEYLYLSGFKVIPFEITPTKKTPCIKQWKDYDLTLETLLEKVQETQAFGIVVPDGNLVIDLDCAKDDDDQTGCRFIGLDNLAEMSEELADRDLSFLNTVTTNTPTGGMHLWYRVPKTMKLKNSASLLRQGIDIRVAGSGLVLMPPSRGTTDLDYEFLIDGSAMSVAKMPTWLLSELRERSKIENKLSEEVLERIKVEIDTPAKAKRYLRECANDIAMAPSGARNNTLNAVAYGIYKRVARGEIDLVLADKTIEDAAAMSGLRDREISATIRSAKRSAFV